MGFPQECANIKHANLSEIKLTNYNIIYSTIKFDTNKGILIMLALGVSDD